MPSWCAVNALGWEPGNIHFCLSSILSLFMTWGKLFHLSGSQIYHLLIAKFLFNYKMLYRHLYFRQCGAWKICLVHLCSSSTEPNKAENESVTISLCRLLTSHVKLSGQWTRLGDSLITCLKPPPFSLSISSENISQDNFTGSWVYGIGWKRT